MWNIEFIHSHILMTLKWIHPISRNRLTILKKLFNVRWTEQMGGVWCKLWMMTCSLGKLTFWSLRNLCSSEFICHLLSHVKARVRLYGLLNKMLEWMLMIWRATWFTLLFDKIYCHSAAWQSILNIR